MDCDPGKIRNPDTGRCVSKTGAIGRRLMRTQTTQAAAPAGNENRCPPCTPEKICNPDTGRCVLKTGAIGRRLTGTRTGEAAPRAVPKAEVDAFFIAIYRDEVDKVRELVRKRPELVNQTFVEDDGETYTPLEIGATHIGMVRVLLELGANARVGAPLSHAIEYARENDATPIVKLLLAHGADPNNSDAWGTALMYAVVYGGINLVKTLLDAGADPRRAGRSGKDAFSVTDHAPQNVENLLRSRR